jgi:hypothetical protein
MAIATISVNFASTGDIQAGTSSVVSVNPSNLKAALQSGSSLYNLTVGGAAFQGAVTVTTGGLTVTSGGATITAGGLTVSAGGYTVTGDSSVTGKLTVTDDVVAFYSSDARLKNNIQKIESALDKVNKLSGVSFDWNAESGHTGKDYGVIAQEVEAVLPEIVVTRDNGYKAVSYDKLIPLLIEAIKELSNKR